MPGIKITVPVAFTDETLPILRNDPILSAGSLFLFDPSHSQGAFTGVPAKFDVVPNIAWETAKQIIGSGDASTLGGRVDVANANASTMLIERSGKGGFHSITSQVNQTVGQGLVVSPATLIQQYIDAHVDDDLYFSTWYRLTRRAAAANVGSAFGKLQTTSTLLFSAQNGTPYPSSGATTLGTGQNLPVADELTAPGAGGSPRRRSIGTTGYTGTKPSMSDVGLGLGVGSSSRGLNFNAGGSSDAWLGLGVNKAASRILYRGYAENLTVSGRTFAEVDAIDAAEFAKAFASGGRFFGDTYTDPATFP